MNSAFRTENAAGYLAALVESSEDAIISKTLEGTVVTWNVGAERIYGYLASEAVGRQMTFLLPADRPDEEAAILQRIRNGERVEHFETIRRTKSGKLIDVSLTISPVRSRTGEIIAASHVAREISESKLLAQQFRHLAAIIECSDDAVISKTLDGVIITWNAGAERVYGYAAAEVIGHPMTLLLPEDRPDEESLILERIRKGERVEHFETVRRTKTGGLIDVSLTISPVRGVGGHILAASHVARNITYRRELDHRYRHLASIVESSEDAIISKTLEGVITTWNSGAQRVYGYAAVEVIGRRMTLLLPADRPDEETLILDRIRRGERVEHFETVRRTKSEDLINVSLTISPVVDEAGTIVGASHVARNITARKRLDEQLRQTQKLESLGLLAGGVAHDFNNLLTGILGNTSLAIESLSTNHPLRGPLRDVLNASERAAHLTRQLLAYAGKGRFVVEPIDISGLVKEISALIQTSIPKNVQLRLELRDDLPAVEADASQLQQVIMNLVINGAEAIGPDKNGTVFVTTARQHVDEHYAATTFSGSELVPGIYINLEIHDTGCGMSPETVAQIFDPFFTTKFTGRGLGLAAVQGIVKGHKGAIRVYSRPDQGTTFKVLLPAGLAVPTPGHEHEFVLPRSGGEDVILVIDDEDIIRRTAKSMLERYGFTVVVAENGKEGVDLFRLLADKITLVLLDMAMPVMNGEETFRHLREMNPKLKVVLSSGYNEVEAVTRFTGKGLAGFIQKPYSSPTLIEKIMFVLDLSV